LQSYNRYSYGWNNPLNGTDPSGFSVFTRFRDAVYIAAAAYVCGPQCAAAVGAYQGGRNGGGLQGAIIGGITAYVGAQYSMTNPTTGAINWGNVAVNASVNATAGCVSASSAGGSCGQGALMGTIGTLGSVYGLPGVIAAGCANGTISGAGCGAGARNAAENYAINSAAQVTRRYLSGDIPGQSRPLSAEEKERYKSYYSSDVLDKTRITDNGTPFWLPNKFVGITLYDHIFFKEGALDSELLSHELVHVEQYSKGLTIGGYIMESVRNGYYNNKFEIEAYGRQLDPPK
jgi:hypothetical protein